MLEKESVKDGDFMHPGHAQKIIYLDVCALCRPFDNPSSLRIRMECDAVLLIEDHVRQGVYRTFVSPMHVTELNATADLIEQQDVLMFLRAYGENVRGNLAEIRTRAEELFCNGLGAADAAHVAFAESENAIFITCDDRLEKKCQKTKVRIPCMNPLRFCEQENLR
jgi:predicted nucleic acid-binding protein